MKTNWLYWAAVAGGVGLVAVLIACLDLKWLHDEIGHLNGPLVFALIVLLPLAGVPVSVLYIVGGAKFGPVWGVLLIAAAIACHLVLSWWIAHGWLKRPMVALMRKLGRRIPEVHEDDYVAVCLVVALIPGLSYALKNYLLVLAGVPFRPYFWTVFPAHVVNASLAIFFGGFTGDMTPPKVIFLAGYALALMALSHQILRRMKARAESRTSTPLEAEAAQNADS